MSKRFKPIWNPEENLPVIKEIPEGETFLKLCGYYAHRHQIISDEDYTEEIVKHDNLRPFFVLCDNYGIK